MSCRTPIRLFLGALWVLFASPSTFAQAPAPPEANDTSQSADEGRTEGDAEDANADEDDEDPDVDGENDEGHDAAETEEAADDAVASNTQDEDVRRLADSLAEDIRYLRALLEGQPLPGTQLPLLFGTEVRTAEARAQEEARLSARLARESEAAGGSSNSGADTSSDPSGDEPTESALETNSDEDDSNENNATSDITEDNGATSENTTNNAETNETNAEPDASRETTGDGTPSAGHSTDDLVGEGSPGGDADASSPPSTDDDTSLQLRLDVLRRQADSLRLALLRLPNDEWAHLLRTVDTQRSLEEREATARAAAEAAEANRLRAETARVEATEAARTARSESQRRIAESRVALRSEQAAIAEAVRDAVHARQEEQASEESRVAVLQQAEDVLRGAESEESAVSAAYDLVVETLIESRQALREALEARVELPTATVLPPGAVAPLRSELLETEQTRSEAKDTIADLDRQRVKALAESLHQANELRLQLFAHLPPDQRAVLNGYGPLGRAQLLREVDQLVLSTRATYRRALHELPSYPRHLWELATVPATRTPFALLLLTVLGSLVLWRRRDHWLAALAGALERYRGERSWRGVGRPVWNRVRLLAGPAILATGALVALHLGRRLGLGPYFELLTDLVLAWSVYRLLVLLAIHEIAARATHLKAEERQAIERTVRRLGRFILASVLLLDGAARMVGEGTLYSHVLRLLLLAGLILVVLLFVQWHEGIRKHYQDHHPKGRLVRALEHPTRVVRWLGTIAAFFVLVADWAGDSLQGLAGGFAGGRKVLALLSQRKLNAADTADAPEVAKKRRMAFECDAPTADEQVDHYPQLAEVLQRHGLGNGAAFALVGEAGIGKSLWLAELARRAEGVHISAPPSCYSAEAFETWLTDALGHDGDLDSLTETLASGPPRVIAIDDCQNFYLRCIGGNGAYQALAALVGSTQHTVIWCCGFSWHAWSYLRSARAGQNMFERTIALEGWSERRIEAMCMRRAERAELKLRFGSLLPSPVTGRARERAVEKAREEYFRILWHYANGNPRVALHFWQQSLTPGRRGAWDVQIFNKPDLSLLEGLHEESRFVLASVALHETLDPRELSRTLRMPLPTCVALLRFLETRRLLDCEGDRYRVSTHWFRAVILHLRRRRLLFS